MFLIHNENRKLFYFFSTCFSQCQLTQNANNIFCSFSFYSVIIFSLYIFTVCHIITTNELRQNIPFFILRKWDYITLVHYLFGPKDKNILFWSQNFVNCLHVLVYLLLYVIYNNVSFGPKLYWTKVKYSQKHKNHKKNLFIFLFTYEI
jgi:hypothetical protein